MIIILILSFLSCNERTVQLHATIDIIFEYQLLNAQHLN